MQQEEGASRRGEGEGEKEGQGREEGPAGEMEWQGRAEHSNSMWGGRQHVTGQAGEAGAAY